MTTAQRDELEQRVLGILRAAPEPMTIPQIEERLKQAGYERVDTFDVREVVWRLIHQEKADFTPRRYIKALP